MDEKGYLAEMKQRIENILNQVGDPGICKGCGAAIYWVKHKNGKAVPYTNNGLNHFVDCPAADRFRKVGGNKK